MYKLCLKACWWVSSRNHWVESDSPAVDDPAFRPCFYKAAESFLEDFFEAWLVQYLMALTCFRDFKPTLIPKLLNQCARTARLWMMKRRSERL